MSKPEPHSAIERELAPTPYRWVKALARGAQGEVHVVEHRELSTLAALKLLRADRTEANLADRLRAEARLLTFLSHPNLVRVLDFGWTQSKLPYLVSELLEGETLGEKLQRERRLPADEAADLALQTLRGLAAAHVKGIIHRDVKPDNLFVTGNERKPCVKILDFGVAKILWASTKQLAGKVEPTAEGLLIGTPSYVAPEQIIAKSIDARADLYGVGCVIFRMLAGRPPFVRDNQIELFRAHISDVATFPGAPPADAMTARLQAVALRALAKDPNDRFNSAEAMALAIEVARRVDSRPVAQMRGPAPLAQIRTERFELPSQVRTERLAPLEPMRRPAPSTDAAAPRAAPHVQHLEIDDPESSYLEALRRKRTRPIQPLLEAPIIATDEPASERAPRQPLAPRHPIVRRRSERVLLILVIALALIIVFFLGLIVARLGGGR